MENPCIRCRTAGITRCDVLGPEISSQACAPVKIQARGHNAIEAWEQHTVKKEFYSRDLSTVALDAAQVVGAGVGSQHNAVRGGSGIGGVAFQREGRLTSTTSGNTGLERAAKAIPWGEEI